MLRLRTRPLLTSGLIVIACGGSAEMDRDVDDQEPGDGDVASDGDGDGISGDPYCLRGDTRRCVGPGACTGGQVCREDQSGWEDCDCGGDGDASGGWVSTGGVDSAGGTEASGGATGGTSTGGGGTATGGAPAGGVSGTGGNPPSGGAVGVGGTGGGSTLACSGSHPPTITGNYADNGTFCGFAWTASRDATISPECALVDASDCFMGSLCATATISPNGFDNDVYPFVMIGWNLSDSADGTMSGTWTAIGAGLTPQFTRGGATGEVRIVLQSGGVDYCATATSGSFIPWSSFSVECWEGGAQSPAFSAGSPVTSANVLVLGDDTTQQLTDFCLTDIVLN